MAEPEPSSAPAAPAPVAPVAPVAAPSAASVAPTAPRWTDSLAEGLRGEKTLQQYKDVNAAAQALVEAKRWQSGATKIPGDDAKPEEIAAFREKLGVPKAPSDYDFTAFGDQVDAARVAEVVPDFHALGLTQKQAVGLIERLALKEQTWKAREHEEYLQAHDKLASEWGSKVYDRRAQLVARLVEQFGGPEVAEFLEPKHGVVGRRIIPPPLFKMLVPIAERFAVDRTIDGKVEGGSTPDQLRARISEIRKQQAEIRDDTPQFRQLQAELEETYKQLIPS